MQKVHAVQSTPVKLHIKGLSGVDSLLQGGNSQFKNSISEMIKIELIDLSYWHRTKLLTYTAKFKKVIKSFEIGSL